MKKLITMLASAAMAFGLYATPEFKAGTCFNSWTDTATHGGDVNLTWANISAESTLINPAGWSFGEDAVPAKWSNEDPENALNIKSALDAFATVTPTDPIVLGAGEKVYVDTLVKFTAFDQDAEIAGSNAKLAVWIKEEVDEKDEPTGNTKLYITAGAVDGVELAAKPVNYECTCDGFAGTDWCRLTIKSMGDVGADTGVRGFAVYINGEPVKCTGISFGTLTLSPLAKYYADNNMLFPSLGDAEITTLAFAGQGAIDDISFTTLAPSFAADLAFYTITWDSEKTGAVSFDVTPASKGAGMATFQGATLPGSITMSWVGNATYAAGSETFTPADGETGTTSKYVAGVALVGEQAYATFEAAVGAADANGTVKLLAAADAAAVTKALTLDLAGFDLAGEIQASANLIVTNSSTEKVGKIVPATEQLAIEQTAGNLAIYGGAFDGVIDINDTKGGTATCTIYGGFFKPSEVGEQEFYLNDYVADGLVASYNGDYGYWEVVEPTIAIIVKDDGATTNKYGSLRTALAAAVNGDKVIIVADETIDPGPHTEPYNSVVISGTSTNEYAITIENNATVTFLDGTYAVLIDGATVTLTGTGTWARPVVTGGQSIFRCGATTPAAVIVNGGTYVGGTNGMWEAQDKNGPSNLFQGKSGTIVINDGSFTNWRYDQARCVRADADTATASVTVNGGTFVVRDDAVGINKTDGRLLPIDCKAGSVSIPLDSTLKVKAHPENVAVMSTYCPTGYKLKLDTEDSWYKVAEIQYATLEVTGDANVDNIVVTNAAGEAIVAGPFDIDDAVVAAFKEATFASGYELDAAKSTLTVGPMTEKTTYTITVAATAKAYAIAYKYVTNDVEIAAADIAGLENSNPTSFTVEKAVTISKENIMATDYNVDAVSSTGWAAGAVTADQTVTVTLVAKAAPAPTPVKPGEEIKPEDGDDITKINGDDTVKAKYLVAPGDVETDKAYRDLFDAVDAGEGKVKFELNSDGSNAVVQAETAASSNALTQVLAATGDSAELSIAADKVLKGFFYSLKQGGELKSIDFKTGDINKLGGKDEITFTLDKPANAGFYEMIVTPKALPVEEVK